MTTPILPHSIEAEEATLGSLIIDPDGYGLLGATLASDDFFKRQNGMIFEAIGEASRNGGVNIVTISDRLERAGKLKEAGGLAELTRLINCTPTSLHLQAHAKTVAGYALRRRGLRALSAGAKHLYNLDLDATTAHASAEGELVAVRRGGEKHVVGAQGLAGELYDQVQGWIDNPLKPGEVRGLATGIKALDRLLGGLVPAVYIVAARPSMGKTALMLQMAAGICAQGERVVFFTIEMSAKQCGFRLASCIAEVELEQIRRGTATPRQMQKLMKALGEIGDWPLTIIDQSTLRPPDVLASVRRQQIAHRSVGAVFIDGLWLMAPTKDTRSRVQDVGSISREMKRIQRELELPIVMAHQLNRNVEYRKDKKPLLADLRETGDIEQDADVVLMLYREGQYDTDSSRANVLEILRRKNRLDGPGHDFAEVFWQGRYMKCTELSKESDG